MYLVQIKSGKAFPLDAADVTPASFDPQDALLGIIERVGIGDLGAGVAPAKIRDAQVGAQDVRPVSQKLGVVQFVRNAINPPVFQIAQLFLDLHYQKPLGNNAADRQSSDCRRGTTNPETWKTYCKKSLKCNRLIISIVKQVELPAYYLAARTLLLWAPEATSLCFT